MARDPLLAPFAELCGALRGLQEQVEQLTRVHEAVDDFNSAFGAFQGAMALHGSCLSYLKNPLPKSRKSLPKEKQTPPGTGNPADDTNNKSLAEKGAQKKSETKKTTQNKAEKTSGVKKQGLVGVKRPGKGEHNMKKRRRTQGSKTNPRAWKWERHIREKIPRKYQSPTELKKLENIVLYLKNRHCAISITDLVKHSGLPVIRCKEILQTLMKLDIVERKREKSGFVYSFGSSNQSHF